MAQIFALIFILICPVSQCLQLLLSNHPTLFIFLSRINVGLCRPTWADRDAKCLEHLENCLFQPVARSQTLRKKLTSSFWLGTHLQDHNSHRFRTKYFDSLTQKNPQKTNKKAQYKKKHENLTNKTKNENSTHQRAQYPAECNKNKSYSSTNIHGLYSHVSNQLAANM